MVRFSCYSIVFIFISFSCRRNSGNDIASSICNCYDQIHDESVRAENEIELQKKVEVCNTMLSSKLASFGSNEEGRTIFMKAFRTCQEN